MPGINEKLKKYYNGLAPQNQRYVILGGLTCLLIVVGGLGYMGRSNTSVHEVNAPEQKKDISLDPKLIERSQLAEAERQREDQNKKMQELKQELDNMKKQKPSDLKPSGGFNKERAMTGMPEAGNSAETERINAQSNSPKNYPEPPLPSPPSAPGAKNAFTKTQGNGAAQDGANIIGGIEIVSNTGPLETAPSAPGPTPGSPDDKKKEQKKVYLAPSFMEGTLLSGLDAPVVESARKDPMPVLIRINDLAVLPNEVKANLRGCFVIAHGYGNLASERAELKLVSLSCISKKGEAVIDQPINGFVVDADGKIGLAGKVVAKLGALLARSAIAGFMQGVGDFLKASTTTTQVTGSGTIQTIDTNKLVSAGLGGGISNAAGDLAKFYNELARMSMPVIEVGATKKITVVVSEGLDLAIKDKRMVEEK